MSGTIAQVVVAAQSNVVVSIHHANAWPVLARLDHAIVDHLPLHASQYSFAKLGLEDGCASSDLPVAECVSTTTPPGAHLISAEEATLENIQEILCVAEKACGLLDGISSFSLLSQLALVSHDAFYTWAVHKLGHAVLLPGGCIGGVLMQEICTSLNLAGVELAAPSKMHDP